MFEMEDIFVKKPFQTLLIVLLSCLIMKLSGLIDAISNNDEEVVITRNGRPAAVLISPDEFESMRETIAIRSDMVTIYYFIWMKYPFPDNMVKSTPTIPP